MTGVSQNRILNLARIEDIFFCHFWKPPLTTLLGSFLAFHGWAFLFRVCRHDGCSILPWMQVFAVMLKVWYSLRRCWEPPATANRKQIAISGFGAWRNYKVLTVLVFGSRRDNLVRFFVGYYRVCSFHRFWKSHWSHSGIHGRDASSFQNRHLYELICVSRLSRRLGCLSQTTDTTDPEAKFQVGSWLR